MTKAFLRKSWIILISACFVSTAIALACAGDWDPEYGASNFTPEIFVDSTYSPFFYSNLFYYGINYDDTHLTRWNTRNIQDWTTWLGKTARPEEVGFLLDTANITTIGQALDWMNGKRPVSPLPYCHLLTDKKDKKITAFLLYLHLAKKCEAFSLTPIRYAWEQDSTAAKKPPFNAGTLDKQLQQELSAAVDIFLQERYWFQLIRSHFFNGTPRESIRLFETYSPKFPRDKLWYRSLAYTAGAWYRLKNYSRANYYYSRVFDSCEELRMVAHYSFHPQEEADWTATLALCHTKEEKATLWQMLGIFYSDPKRAIEQIYALDPQSDKLDLLLSRAINASEQRFATKLFEGITDMPNEPNYHSNDSLRVLVTRIAGARNAAKPWIWQLAAGYLCMLDRDYQEAANWYQQAEPIVPHALLPREQFRMLKLLNTIAAAPVIDEPLEKQLTPEIDWLLHAADTPSGPGFRHEAALEWLKQAIADKYTRAGDKVRSECWTSRPAYYADDHQVEALRSFLDKPDKSPWEKLCTRMCATGRADLYEYQAIGLCLDDHIDNALTAIRLAAPHDTTILPGNPFNARIVDCHDCDHIAPQKISYSKLSFLQTLKKLQDKIAAGQDVFTNAILMGNAQYNITHFGNARAFYECKVIGSDMAEPSSIDTTFRTRLLNMNTAVKYYTMALGAAKTDEQRAKCQYLLAKCQRNAWYAKNVFSKEDYRDYEGPAFMAWDGFQALKQYSGTNYYKEVLHECGYFRTYVQKHP